MKKTVGVLGGMGPEATARFFYLLTQLTPAERDQDHLSVLIFSEPSIPDRTAHILKGAPSPLPALIKTAQRLQAAGADLIAIPCNTAHYFYEEIRASVSIPILHIIEETALQARKEVCRRETRQDARVAILATQGTLASGLYQRGLEKYQIGPWVPSEEIRHLIQHSIERIKAKSPRGETVREVNRIIRQLVDEAAIEGVILGCTELGLLEPDLDPVVPILDSLKILAQATVRSALDESQ